MVGEVELKILNGIFQLAGTFFATQMTSGKGDEQKALDEYYKKVSKAVKNAGTGPTSDRLQKLQQALEEEVRPLAKKLEQQSIQRTQMYQEPVEHGDLTEERIIEGKSCLPCSSEHIGQAAALLKEAVRFAVRDKGIKDDEVEDRVHDALLELNALERKDLTPEKIEKMRPEEQELAIYYMNKSAEIRHKLNDIKSADDLIKASSFATGVSKEIHKKVWDMSVGSGTVEHLCDKSGMNESERKACMESVQEALDNE